MAFRASAESWPAMESGSRRPARRGRQSSRRATTPRSPISTPQAMTAKPPMNAPCRTITRPARNWSMRNSCVKTFAPDAEEDAVLDGDQFGKRGIDPDAGREIDAAAHAAPSAPQHPDLQPVAGKPECQPQQHGLDVEADRLPPDDRRNSRSRSARPDGTWDGRTAARRRRGPAELAQPAAGFLEIGRRSGWGHWRSWRRDYPWGLTECRNSRYWRSRGRICMLSANPRQDVQHWAHSWLSATCHSRLRIVSMSSVRMLPTGSSSRSVQRATLPRLSMFISSRPVLQSPTPPVGNRLVEMFDIGRQVDELGILSLQPQQVLGDGAVGQPPGFRAAIPGVQVDHVRDARSRGTSRISGSTSSRLSSISTLIMWTRLRRSGRCLWNNSSARTARSHAPGQPRWASCRAGSR